MQQQKCVIVTPVYNDWDCFKILHRELIDVFKELNIQLTVVAVNDGSTLKPEQYGIIPQERLSGEEGEILIVELQRNLGHQKAISTGITYVSKNLNPDFVIVMDSDGEDQPSDIVKLIEQSRKEPDKIVFAMRRSRQESRLFKFMYYWYKWTFKLLSGYVITFGNFVLLPREKLSNLIYISEIWNHFPGGIIRSKLVYTSVPIDRGKRYTGQSKMNMISLVQHGISSITVNIDIVSVRLLVFSFLLILLTICLLIILVYVRFFTNFAIPGWTSNMGIGLLMIMLQAFFFSLLLTFTVLNNRVQKTFVPAIDVDTFVRSIKQYRITTP